MAIGTSCAPLADLIGSVCEIGEGEAGFERVGVVIGEGACGGSLCRRDPAAGKTPPTWVLARGLLGLAKLGFEPAWTASACGVATSCTFPAPLAAVRVALRALPSCHCGGNLAPVAVRAQCSASTGGMVEVGGASICSATHMPLSRSCGHGYPRPDDGHENGQRGVTENVRTVSDRYDTRKSVGSLSQHQDWEPHPKSRGTPQQMCAHYSVASMTS